MSRIIKDAPQDEARIRSFAKLTRKNKRMMHAFLSMLQKKDTDFSHLESNFIDVSVQLDDLQHAYWSLLDDMQSLKKQEEEK